MKIIGWIIVTPFIALALFVAARYMFCGPNREVIRVAKPVVKIIADDIVKNGIPESLADIKGLPYELEGCKRKEIYEIDTFNRKVVETREEADYIIITEGCSFVKKNKSYSVSLWFVAHYKYQERSHGQVGIYNKDTYTGLGISFEIDKNSGMYKYNSIGDGYAKHHGVLCGSFKQ